MRIVVLDFYFLLSQKTFLAIALYIYDNKHVIELSNIYNLIQEVPSTHKTSQYNDCVVVYTAIFIHIFYLKFYEQWGSPHGALDPDPMWIEDPDQKTTLPPHGLDLDPSSVLCCVTVREINPAVQCT